MPIYEYQCDHCGETSERIQKISDPTLTDCRDCGESALKKRLSAPAFRLKGSGWYETDFKGGKKKNLASSDNHSPASSSKSDSSSSASAGS